MGTGTLSIWTDVWATVTVDGKSLGRTPLFGVKLSAGRHKIKLENTALGKVKTVTVRIRVGQESKLTVRLRD